MFCKIRKGKWFYTIYACSRERVNGKVVSKDIKLCSLAWHSLYEIDEEINGLIEDVPVDWVITTDRKYFQQATIVVFHLPTLHYELENDLDKLEGQTWVSWHLESEKDDPGINDPEISELFDLSISDPQDSEGEQHPLLRLCRNYVNNG